MKKTDDTDTKEYTGASHEEEEHADYAVCPCCGCHTLDPEDSAFEICPVCFWENDPSQIRYPDEPGANKISLNQAKKNYEEFGACEERYIEYVRKPLPEEVGE